jgi:RimJ/RimL family protein N-acetyltransferase
MEASLDLESERVLLRQWVESDVPSFVQLNSDPKVMQYFPQALTEQESRGFVSVMSSVIDENGWGFWAAELKSSGDFIGFVGLNIPRTILPFSPCVEVGWRLHKEYWGNGYATEGGRVSLAYAFECMKIDEVVSFTTKSNYKSRKVMERLGMENTGENFKYPDIPNEHPLSEHVLYKISKAQWSKGDL